MRPPKKNDLNVVSVGGQTLSSNPANVERLPACLLGKETSSNNKKSHLERALQGKRAKFAADYPVGSERKSAIAVLLQKLEERKGRFKKWMAQALSLCLHISLI